MLVSPWTYNYISNNLVYSAFQEIVINGHAINQLHLVQAKLQPDPTRAALKLLAVLFSAEELVNGNPNGTTNSKDHHRQQTIRKLDPKRLSYTEGTVHFTHLSPP